MTSIIFAFDIEIMKHPENVSRFVRYKFNLIMFIRVRAKLNIHVKNFLTKGKHTFSIRNIVIKTA